MDEGAATLVAIGVCSGEVPAGDSGNGGGCSGSREQPVTIAAIRIAPSGPDVRCPEFRIRTLALPESAVRPAISQACDGSVVKPSGVVNLGSQRARDEFVKHAS